jgi:hypothetical protein
MLFMSLRHTPEDENGGRQYRRQGKAEENAGFLKVKAVRGRVTVPVPFCRAEGSLFAADARTKGNRALQSSPSVRK